MGSVKSKVEKDRIIQQCLENVLVERDISLDDKSLKHHMEHIVMIRLGKSAQAGTLTFEKFNQMKEEHQEEMAEKLLQKEIESYDFDTDVFSRLNSAMTTQDISKKMLDEKADAERSHIRIHYTAKKTKSSDMEKNLPPQYPSIDPKQMLKATGGTRKDKDSSFKVEKGTVEDNIKLQIHVTNLL